MRVLEILVCAGPSKQKGPEISLQPLCYVNLLSLTLRGFQLCRPIQYLRLRP